jgi:quercetin dioxygenase-like cupin family protein
MTIVGANEGPVYRVVGDEVRMLASGDAYEVFELRGPANSGPPPHMHPWNEAYFVIDGEVDVLVGGHATRATAGSFVSIPAGTVHCYRILSSGAKFLVLTSPSGASAFFEEMDRETGGSCDDMAAVVRVANKHCVTTPPA